MLLVTGITGHTGSYFLKELIKNNYNQPLRCVVRENSDTSLLDTSGLDIEKVVGDLDDPLFINRIMVGVDTVMHIYNIHHSPLIVKSAIERKVKRVILVHTTGIYSKYKSASSEYKRIEQVIAEFKKMPECKTAITILRPSMIYGDTRDRNISKFIKMVDMSRIIPVIKGGQSLIQPVNARDLGRAYYDVLVNPHVTDGKEYNLTGNRPITIKELLAIISKELNKKSTFINVPQWLAIIIAKTTLILSIGRFNVVEKVQRMAENRSYSHEKAVKDFGYNPIMIEEGIKLEVAQYLEEKNEKSINIS